MEYEKDKINRLIDYKDNMKNEILKNDLEWIIGKYNEYFIRLKDCESREKEHTRMMKRYFNIEDEKAVLKEKLQLRTRRYITLKERYRELEAGYKQICKKLKSMI